MTYFALRQPINGKSTLMDSYRQLQEGARTPIFTAESLAEHV